MSYVLDTPFSEKAAAKFWSLKPCKISTIQGHKYYECPLNGDEVPMIVVTPEGVVQYSHHHEIDDQLDCFDSEYI